MEHSPDGETMRTESLHRRMRELLRSLLQELDVAGACIETIRYAVPFQASAHTTAAALSLYRSWARAERAVESLARVGGGAGASLDFARDALLASRRAGARALSELLTMVSDTARLVDGAVRSP
jgi:hypothetical protein